MYIDIAKRKTPEGKVYQRVLLRDSYRKDGKVKHHTVANLSSCSAEEIEAMRLALRHKKDLTNLGSLKESLRLVQGPAVGAVWLVVSVAKQLGIARALGNSRQGKLALWQVVARVIDQGSRLSAVRLAQTHAACDILDLESFNEDDLYANLDWLCENQATLENRLFRQAYGSAAPQLYLYDVTSTYLEGHTNDLGAFGYNRDGKKGKLQLVIGLLCDQEGMPLSIEVFNGNLQDPKTLASQISKVAHRFGGGDITFVGDRGMIKSKQVQALLDKDFHYITAITKQQIRKLLQDDVFQMSLFDEELSEVIQDDTCRYILRRNPFRAQEIQENRNSKLLAVRRFAAKKNLYLLQHPRASVNVAIRNTNAYSKKLKVNAWVTVNATDRTVLIAPDLDALKSISKIDGCYVIKTDLRPERVPKEIIHERYKDLTQVEWAFRESKTTFLELRPVNVRRGSRTRGHVFVVMLAYLITRHLRKLWRSVEKTVEEGIQELSQLCAHDILIDGQTKLHNVPEPRPLAKQLLDLAKVKPPQIIRNKGVHVATRVKLAIKRKNN